MISITLPCARCGAANPSHAVFCNTCGQSLRSEATGGTHTRILSSHTLLKTRYRILDQAGQGGFGSVYKAADTRFDERLVAIKVMEQQGLSQEEITEAVASFKREALMLANLRHPHLPRIYDHFSDEGRWYLVMDYIEGQTLESYQQQFTLNPRIGKRQLPVEEVLAIGVQLCSVLDYLHTRQPPIIFRDLKPANVMRASERHLYLIDFGIARHFKPGQIKDTMPLGSPGYAAPEQYGKVQTTPRADIYSLGVTLHQLLSGDDPSISPFVLTPLQAQGYHPAYARVAALIQQMTQIDEQYRPATMTVVKEELQHIANQPTNGKIWTVPQEDPSPTHFIAETDTAVASHQQQQLFAGQQQQEETQKSPQHDTSRRLVVAGLAGLGLAGLAGVLGWRLFATAKPMSAVAQPGSSLPTVMTQSTALPQDNNPVQSVPGATYVYTGHTDAVTALAWSPDWAYIASGSADKTVQVWSSDSYNAQPGKLLSAYRGYTSPVTAVAWSQFGADSTGHTPPYIASAGNKDRAVQVWNTQTGQLTTEYTQLTSRVLALAWQSGTDNVVMGAADGTAQVWNTKTGQTIATYTGHSGAVQALDTYSTHYSTHVASGGADTILHIWDSQTGKTVATYSGHTGAINAVLWLAETLVASASEDGTVRVWNTLNSTVLVYNQHKGPVKALTSIAMFIASGGADNTVHVWEYANGRHRSTYTGHKATVRALSFYPAINGLGVKDGAPTPAPAGTEQGLSGLIFASAGDDKTVQIWSPS